MNSWHKTIVPQFKGTMRWSRHERNLVPQCGAQSRPSLVLTAGAVKGNRHMPRNIARYCDILEKTLNVYEFLGILCEGAIRDAQEVLDSMPPVSEAFLARVDELS